MVKWCLIWLLATSSCFSSPELLAQYEEHCRELSDINEHLPCLRQLAQRCGFVTEIGVNEVVSTWGILQGLSESGQAAPRYLGIDLKYPALNRLFLADQLATSSGILFEFIRGNDFDLDIEPTDMLFIDSWHTYCHLRYELEKFSSKVRKYIAMHDTSEPWGDEDEPCYLDVIPPYPPYIDRTKKGLWLAVEDFLAAHPEWVLEKRYFNNHGFTVLSRKNE